MSQQRPDRITHLNGIPLPDSPDMVANENRTDVLGTRSAGGARSIPELIEKFVRYIETYANERPLELKRVSQMFAPSFKRFGYSLSTVLETLEAKGTLSAYVSLRDDRTYVFGAKLWNEYIGLPDQVNQLEKYVNALADEASVSRRARKISQE